MRIVKYSFISCLFAASTACVAISCSKEGAPDATRQAVRFTAGISAPASTRASGTQWSAGDKIGIRMTDASGATVEGYANVPYTADAAGAFTPAAGSMYYPVSGGKVGFTAYYPYTAALQEGSLAVNLADQSRPETIDLLYAATAVDYNKFSAGGVALPFRHAMSKLTLKTLAGTGLTPADLAGMQVSVSGLNTAAAFNTATGALTGASAPAAIVPRTVSDGSSYEAIVLPAALDAQTMQVTFTVGGNPYVWRAPAFTFESGTAYLWTITISRTGITATVGNITPWGTDNPVIADETKKYKIGDYYPDPLNPATAIGVVYKLDSYGRTGLMVGLNETTKNWGEAQTWAAAQTAGGRTWRCPDKDELRALCFQILFVNTALGNISGAAKLMNSLYWSSSEFNDSQAWSIYFTIGYASKTEKYEQYRVRAVSAF